MNLSAQSINILILEDDKDLGTTLQENLTNSIQNCSLAVSCEQAMKLANDSLFDIFILDVNLPDGNGLNVGKHLLKKFPTAPIIFLSAASDPELRLQGLELGAFDFINKPFTLKELQIKLQRIIKDQFNLTSANKTVEYGPLKINFSKFELTDANGNAITLTHKECSILKVLYDNLNHVVSRDQILDNVWGQDSFPTFRTVDNYIVNLRKWCDTDHEQHLAIQSIRGVGYKMTTRKN